MTFSAALLLQKNPVWQALLDDAEERGAVVRDANAAELFPNMTELHLMQANRKAPASGPLQDPSIKGTLPAGIQAAGIQGPEQDLNGVSQAARGAGAGRGGARGGRAWRQGGPGRLPGVPAQGPVNNNAAGPAQIQQQQQTLPSTQGSFAANVHQDHLTPARQAIQQGKLQQQQHHDQPVSAQHQQMLPQQQQQQLFRQGPVTDQAAAQQTGSSMQGVQHSHWDTSYSGGAPYRDPRQMPIDQSHTGLQAGAIQGLNRPPGPRPAGTQPLFDLAHQDRANPLTADPVLGLGVHAVQHASAAGDTFAGQVPNGTNMLQYPGAAPPREHHARSAMPAIPGASGQQAIHGHSMFGVDVDQQEHGGVDAPRQGQGPTQLQEDSIALGSLRQTNAISTSPHATNMVQAGDPGRALKGSDFVVPIAAQVAQDLRPGRNNIWSRHGEATSQVPQWTNNRR